MSSFPLDLVFHLFACLFVFKPQHPSNILQIFTFSPILPVLNVFEFSFISVIPVSCFFLHLSQAFTYRFSSSFHGNCEPVRRVFRSKEKGIPFMLEHLTHVAPGCGVGRLCLSDPDIALTLDTSLSVSWMTVSTQRRIWTKDRKQVQCQRIFGIGERKQWR